ncbi:MAG: MFS transporter [Thermogemmatispora sp.]|uniref:MFS transporter n=1 Tax=Thermogemmatispora sp. TaxID=1968838 RepID=UPI00260518AA|nr:MFS transporter [Thermogemmatispora sp.]MBX5455893.1 MFS transporter [Thermogemmatispora sp.]
MANISEPPRRPAARASLFSGWLRRSGRFSRQLTQRFTFARALASRPFRLLWLGQTISNVGNNVFSLALAWQVLLMTHSATAMGLILMAKLIPNLAFVLIGGVAADRLPRRSIVLWSDGLRGLVLLSVTVLGVAGLLQLWLLVVESLIFGIVEGFFNPALMSLPPELVAKEELPSANALTALSLNLAGLVGPALGALLIALVGPFAAFALDAVSFFVSMLLLFPVPIVERHMRPMQEQLGSSALALREDAEGEEEGLVRGRLWELRSGLQKVLQDVGEGLAYVRQSPWIWVTLLSATVGNVCFIATLAVSMPKLVQVVYGQGAGFLGLLQIAESVGSLLSILLLGMILRLGRRGLLAYLMLMLSAAGVLAFGLIPAPLALWLAPLASILVGFGLTFFNTVYFTILQEQVPGDKLGRVVSLDTIGSLGLAPLGQVLGGILTDRVGAAAVFLLFGTLALGNCFYPLLVREVRETL